MFRAFFCETHTTAPVDSLIADAQILTLLVRVRKVSTEVPLTAREQRRVTYDGWRGDT